MSNGVQRFLGDSVLRTILKLLFISFIVGVVMAAMDWHPFDIFNTIGNFIVHLWETGFAAFGRIGNYIALGAAIVIPVFILLRILDMRKR